MCQPEGKQSAVIQNVETAIKVFYLMEKKIWEMFRAQFDSLQCPENTI